jgi:hypothetical protein
MLSKGSTKITMDLCELPRIDMQLGNYNEVSTRERARQQVAPSNQGARARPARADTPLHVLCLRRHLHRACRAGVSHPPAPSPPAPLPLARAPGV